MKGAGPIIIIEDDKEDQELLKEAFEPRYKNSISFRF